MNEKFRHVSCIDTYFSSGTRQPTAAEEAGFDEEQGPALPRPETRTFLEVRKSQKPRACMLNLRNIVPQSDYSTRSGSGYPIRRNSQ
eukprot:COSAG02_NODE_236_length_27740_cov_49.156073_16_plen_87_part_00